jgi:hypothetical protein
MHSNKIVPQLAIELKRMVKGGPHLKSINSKIGPIHRPKHPLKA